MKTTCCIILCFVAFSLAPVKSAETNSAPVNIDQKLRDIDLKLMLAQYEKIQKQLMDLKFNAALLEAGAEDMTDDERKKQITRINRMENVLENELHKLLVRVRQLAGEGVKASK